MGDISDASVSQAFIAQEETAEIAENITSHILCSVCVSVCVWSLVFGNIRSCVLLSSIPGHVCDMF